ncbi:MAG: hypothetical protein CME66_13585 [Halobacteriovoraceae bacterium]|nr:hypothetical protein [Halobacteriovoraceae bacterium]
MYRGLFYFFLTLSSINVYASIVLEPWYGSFTSTETELATQNDKANAMTGNAYGVKLGYKSKSIITGIEVNKLNPKIKDSFLNYLSLSTNNIFIGYQAGALRFELGYIINGRFTGESNHMVDGFILEELKGNISGIKFTLALYLTHFVALNLNFINYDYTNIEAKFKEVSGVTKQDDVVGENIFLVSLSFPLTFL